MPLDVTDALVPDLLSQFQVISRTEVVDNHGRSTITEQPIVPTYGTVCAATPTDLERLEDEDRGNKAISIVTRFRLKEIAPGFKADIVIWHGDRYLVRDVQDYAQMGRGFVQAIAVAITKVPQAAPDDGGT